MPLGLGFGTVMGVGIESTWGTAVARTLWFPVVSESLARKVEKASRNSLAASGSGAISNAHFKVSDNVGGSTTHLVTFEGFGVFWKHILGAAAAPTGPVSGLYTHSLTHTLATLPGLTLEMVRGTTSGVAEVFQGMKANKAVIKAETGKEVTATIDWLGKTSAGRVSAGTPTIATSFTTVALFDQSGNVNFDSVAYTCNMWELTLDNKLARRPLLGSLLSAEPQRSGLMDATLRIEFEWSTDALITAFTADTVGDVTVSLSDSAGRSIQITLKSAYIEDASDPISGVGVIKQTVTFRAQATSSHNGIGIVLVNTQATTLAA